MRGGEGEEAGRVRGQGGDFLSLTLPYFTSFPQANAERTKRTTANGKEKEKWEEHRVTTEKGKKMPMHGKTRMQCFALGPFDAGVRGKRMTWGKRKRKKKESEEGGEGPPGCNAYMKSSQYTEREGERRRGEAAEETEW